jgi:hypothetical protein
MIDVVLFFWFFENRETAPHHKKKQEKIFSDTTARKNLFCNCKKNLLCQFTYQNPMYVISYFKNLANFNCSFHTTKTLLNSTIISSEQLNMGSKKHKGSTAKKAVIHQAHKERTDINVDGSIAGGGRLVHAAAIKGANAAGNSTINVNIPNTTNAAAAGNAVAATTAAAGNAIAAMAATAGNAIAATTATTGDTANDARTAEAAAIKGANATGNSTIKVDIANTTNVATTGDSIKATVAAAGDGVKVTTDMITTEIAEAAMHVINGKTSAKALTSVLWSE